MSIDAQGVVRALVRASESGHERPVGESRRPTIIVSRTMGSGGDAAARALGVRLGLEVYGSEILDAVARQAKVDKKLMSSLNEHAVTAADAWLYAAFFAKNVSRDDYLAQLAATVRALHRLGGVILGRGAYVILENRPALRVRITGSVEACAARVAAEDGIGLEEAKEKVRESNRKRGKFVWDMFHRRLNDPTNFDLVINTDKLASMDPVVDMIIAMQEATGLDLPKAVAAAG